jgi:hypothetical protein
MRSRLFLNALSLWIAWLAVFLGVEESSVHAQVYFTGPYGPGGTWNLYEHRGFEGGERVAGAVEPKGWNAAHQDAMSRLETISGTNARGHLLALAGPTAQQENDFIAARLDHQGTWIGLSDKPAFGGGAAGTDGRAGFGNPPGDGVGWKWTSGEVFDFANWVGPNPRGDDNLAGLSRQRGWYTAGGATSYIIEYETHSPTPLNLPPVPLAPMLPGPAPRAGAFGVREVAINTSIGAWTRGAVRLLQNIPADSIVRDYYTPVIDYQTEFEAIQSRTGPSRPFELLQRGDVPFAQHDNFAMVAHGQILIPEGQGGDWTFSITSDDGFELYIPGARFELAQMGATTITPYGSVRYPGDRASFTTLASTNLQPGVHDIELVYYENTGQALVNLFAARGRKSDVDSSFALVGAPAQNVVGRTPSIPGRFEFLQIRHNPAAEPEERIESIAEAKQVLSTPGENDTMTRTSTTNVNYDNIAPPGSRDSGAYDTDRSFLFGETIAASAKGALVVDTAGSYTFGFSVLDGGELTIGGGLFRENFGEGAITNGGESLTLDRAATDGVALAVVDLMPGTYPLEFVTYNSGGDALAELFVAPGRVDFFDAGAFRLLTTTPTNINYVRPAGLQLVPEPARVVSGLVGVVIVGLMAWRRRRTAS